MRMRRGESAVTFAHKFDVHPPEINMVGKGKDAYLWIGGKGGPCYSYLGGEKALRKLAHDILAALGPSKK